MKQTHTKEINEKIQNAITSLDEEGYCILDFSSVHKSTMYADYFLRVLAIQCYPVSLVLSDKVKIKVNQGSRQVFYNKDDYIDYDSIRHSMLEIVKPFSVNRSSLTPEEKILHDWLKDHGVINDSGVFVKRPFNHLEKGSLMQYYWPKAKASISKLKKDSIITTHSDNLFQLSDKMITKLIQTSPEQSKFFDLVANIESKFENWANYHVVA
ncbi:MAG TPA: hypothetical protein DCL21_00635 [Alphaproteobacteria bacterium]|nr:hypothetical protein [Alphaproteobacteria bacterium]